MQKLHPKRLDIVVKYLFIEGYYYKELEKEPSFYKDLYIKHIYNRTGGYEPDGEKKSVQEYVSCFESLIESIAKKGYTGEPIPVSTDNKIILDGAHRFACCLYFNIEPKIKDVGDKKGLEWDYNWFINNGFSQPEIDLICLKYCQIIDFEVACFVLWSPTSNYWEDMEKEIGNRLEIVMASNYNFSKSDFPKIVRDIYSHDIELNHKPKIEAKIRSIITQGPKFRLILATNFLREESNNLWRVSYNIKRDMRKKYSEITKEAEHEYIILHSTDEAKDTEHVLKHLFNQNSIDMLSLRKGDKIRTEFQQWLEEYEQVLAQSGIDVEETCIVGSSVLEILAIRRSTDIDFIIDSQVRESEFDDESTSLSTNVDLAKRGYHSTTNKSHRISDDKIIYDPQNYFRYRGIKFANPRIVRDSKQQSARKKDIHDIHLMDKHLSTLSQKNNIRYGWELPSWKVKLLTIAPRWDLMMRKKASYWKSSIEQWGSENLPDQVKKVLKKYI